MQRYDRQRDRVERTDRLAERHPENTEKQTDRWAESGRKRDGVRQSQTNRQRDLKIHRQSQTDRQTYMDTPIDIQKDKDRKTERQTGRQADRQTESQRESD